MEMNKENVMQQDNGPSSGQPVLRKRSFPTVFLIVLVSVIVGLIAATAHFYFKYEEAVKRSDPQEELGSLLSKLSIITELPVGETPTLATVTDKTRLSEQAFFSRAENGDKILIYREASRAFLYRPSTGKLVNVTTITDQPAAAAASEQSQEPAPSGQQVQADAISAVPDTESDSLLQQGGRSSTIRVVLYNGTTQAGATNEFQNDFLVDNPDIEVVDKKPAARKDYDRTIVIDISKRFGQVAESIAENAGTSVEALPDGETVPDGIDVLIIIGRDRI